MSEDNLSSDSDRDISDSHETITAIIDQLLERYLNLLDQYQKLRQSMAKSLSSVGHSSRLVKSITHSIKGVYVPCTSEFQQSESYALWARLLR